MGVDLQAPITEARLQAKVGEILGVPYVRLYPPPVEEDAESARHREKNQDRQVLREHLEGQSRSGCD